MRFEFELGDPSHLDTLLAACGRIDSVYDAYRVVPGQAADPRDGRPRALRSAPHK